METAVFVIAVVIACGVAVTIEIIEVETVIVVITVAVACGVSVAVAVIEVQAGVGVVAVTTAAVVAITVEIIETSTASSSSQSPSHVGIRRHRRHRGSGWILCRRSRHRMWSIRRHRRHRG